MESLGGHCRDSLGGHCRDSLGSHCRDSLGGHCRDTLGTHCRDSLGSHCREMLPHAAPAGTAAAPPADGAAPAAFPDLPGPEPPRQCPSGSLGYGYPAFGPGYYGCRLNLQQKPCGGFHAEKFSEPGVPLAGEELPARAKEFAFYPGFAGSYQAVPGYLDVSVVGALGAHPEPRPEALLPVEGGGYQPWALPHNAWDGQLYCPKEQPQAAHLWKSPFPDPAEISLLRTRDNAVILAFIPGAIRVQTRDNSIILGFIPGEIPVQILQRSPCSKPG
ncbi:hypothetical protein HGM15179_019256 [Zosterops borbonicus]|uniref:Homeobox protein Hox1A3 N-terminal domain-containing protein n=1 Tax=Zosterops borbonicus TaxID=364589 RepID=A0A8K1FYP7_9PASS|nr:hypothetical protein HGM15179_019256 [Zosterops borbonicus]